MSPEAFLYSLGITRKNRYFDDCLQEARLAGLQAPADATPAYRRQYIKWCVFNFLNKQLAEDMKVFRAEPDARYEPVEDAVIRRMGRESQYRGATLTMTPFERIVYVLCVSSPLNRAQIAHTLDVSERTVSRAFSEARRKLSITGEMREGRRRVRTSRNRFRKLSPADDFAEHMEFAATTEIAKRGRPRKKNKQSPERNTPECS